MYKGITLYRVSFVCIVAVVFSFAAGFLLSFRVKVSSSKNVIIYIIKLMRNECEKRER